MHWARVGPRIVLPTRETFAPNLVLTQERTMLFQGDRGPKGVQGEKGVKGQEGPTGEQVILQNTGGGFCCYMCTCMHACTKRETERDACLSAVVRTFIDFHRLSFL